MDIWGTIIVGSTFLVYFDASKNKIGKIPTEKGLFNNSAGLWAVGTLLLWIIFFPAYLIKRSSLVEKADINPQEPSARTLKLVMIGVIFVLVLLSDLQLL